MENRFRMPTGSTSRDKSRSTGGGQTLLSMHISPGSSFTPKLHSYINPNSNIFSKINSTHSTTWIFTRFPNSTNTLTSQTKSKLWHSNLSWPHLIISRIVFLSKRPFMWCRHYFVATNLSFISWKVCLCLQIVADSNWNHRVAQWQLPRQFLERIDRIVLHSGC